MSKNTIETIGYILKEEKFSTLKQSIIPNTFVLETQNPFPGYHGKDLPGEALVPEFVFFVTKKKYTTEEIARATRNIRKYLGKDIDVARADLNIFNKTYPAIRVKDVEDFKAIVELQNCYKSEGFEFAKQQSVETTGLINIQKHFYLQDEGDGIYTDLEDEDYAYFEIPSRLNFEQFRAITLKVKNSMEVRKFDVALGLFYRRLGVIDIVRVYDKNMKLDNLKSIKERYDNEVKKLLLDSFK
ncbi:MAG: hypothetical protein HC831_18240 [Chloroflexia bacterium]|nr:hypothetical protein [Chloroflexia bacterium]